MASKRGSKSSHNLPFFALGPWAIIHSIAKNSVISQNALMVPFERSLSENHEIGSTEFNWKESPNHWLQWETSVSLIQFQWFSESLGANNNNCLIHLCSACHGCNCRLSSLRRKKGRKEWNDYRWRSLPLRVLDLAPPPKLRWCGSSVLVAGI